MGSRTGSAVSGVLPLDKPAGLTSFQAVARARRILSTAKIGHGGTLDPVATGVLPLCVGQGTRLADYWHRQSKTYLCTVQFGSFSSTYDSEGDITPQASAEDITAESIESALAEHVGDIFQIPPMYSAVHHEGRRLYELAREGKEVERQPKAVHIDSIELESFLPGPAAQATLRVICGKGAYMRVIADSLGHSLGCGAYLSGLTRTSYGPITLDLSITLDELEKLDDPSEALLPVETSASFLPMVSAPPQVVVQIQRGQPSWISGTDPAIQGECRVHDLRGTLVALGTIQAGHFRPDKVFNLAPSVMPAGAR